MVAEARHNKIPQEEDDELKADVFCNVYDIVPGVNAAARCLKSNWGIYHTGVQVHGLEFAYGGHDDGSTGVFCAKPRSAQGARFREQVHVGRASVDPMELRQLVADLSRRWPGNMYDPFKRNCNHFSEALCQELTNSPAPPYINRFTESRFVRGMFFRCIVPIGRCVERFYRPVGGITYSSDAEPSGETALASDMGVTGARGINQVLLEAATLQKSKANRLFTEGSHGQAEAAYSKALGYLAAMSRRTEEDEAVCQQVQTVRRALILNLAACDLKAGSYESAVERCREVLAMDPTSQKALYRRGVALSHLGAHQEALSDLRAALRLAGEDAGTAKDLRREIERVKRLVEEERQRDRAMARRMLGGAG